MALPREKDGETQTIWQRRTRFAALLMNFAWWVEMLLPALFVAALVLSVLVLTGRRMGWSPQIYGWAAAALFALALAGSFWRARSRFVSLKDARARLEYSLRLHSRLSAADAGVGDWPSREMIGHSMEWNWRRLSVTPIFCIALLIAAWCVPIPVDKSIARLPTAKPPALVQTEEWLELLRKAEAIEPESLEPIEEQAEQLAQQKPDDWYSHASLEAADHLRAKLQAGMQTMDSSATRMESLLGGLDGAGAELTDMQAEAWKEQLQGALAAMDGNMPGLNKALAGQLRQIDPSKMKSISKEQLEKMRESLKKGSGTCKACLGGEGIMDGEAESDRPSRSPGVTRGPGTAPLAFGKEQTDLKTTKVDSLENDDLSRAAIGDQVGMSTGQHDVDRAAAHRSASGGAVAGDGNGPGAVWLPTALPPDERRRLQEFFK